MKKLFSVILSLVLIIAPVGNTGTAHASDGGGLLKQLLGIGNSIMGSMILTKCKMGASQPSLYIYMAGSIIYMIGEISAGKAKKDGLDSQAQRLADLKANSGKDTSGIQRDAIDMQILSEEDNLKVINKRRGFAKATVAVYLAATIMALLEGWWAIPPPVGMGKPDAAACTPNPSSNKVWSMAVATAYAMLAPGDLSAMGLVSGAVMGGMQSGLFKKIFGGAVAAETAGIPFMNSAYTRAAIFGVFAGLVTLILVELNKAKEATEKRIADLKKVRDSMPTDGAGTNTGISGAPLNPNELNSGNYAKLSGGKLKGLANGAVRRTCLGNSSGSMSESACRSPFRVPRANMSGLNIGMPLVSETMNAGADMADALASGDTERAEVLGSSLGSNAARLNKIKDELLKRTNDRLAAEGKPKIDIDGELKKQMANFGNQMNKDFPGSGLGLADAGAGEANVSEALKDETSGAPTPIATTAPVIDPNAGGGLDLKGLDEVGAETPGTDEKVASLSDSLNEYETSEADISKDPGVSIFKQLSNRYILNYTKIFSRKEATPEPAPAEAPKN